MKAVLSLLSALMALSTFAAAQDNHKVQYTYTREGKGHLKSFFVQTNDIPTVSHERSAMIYICEFGPESGPNGRLSPEIGFLFSDRNEGSIAELEKVYLVGGCRWYTGTITFANGEKIETEMLLDRWKKDPEQFNPLIRSNIFNPELDDHKIMSREVARFVENDIVAIDIAGVHIEPEFTVGTAEILGNCFRKLEEEGVPSKYFGEYIPAPKSHNWNNSVPASKGASKAVAAKTPERKPARKPADFSQLLSLKLGVIEEDFKDYTLKGVAGRLRELSDWKFEVFENDKSIYIRNANGYDVTLHNAVIKSASISFKDEMLNFTESYWVDCKTGGKYVECMNDIKEFLENNNAEIVSQKRGKHFLESFSANFGDYEIIIDAYTNYNISITIKSYK